MTRQSPLIESFRAAGASLLPYGPPDPETGLAVEVVETFGHVDYEYAALRKACVLIDLPHRGVLRVTGGDRVGFLNSMVTQELKGPKPMGPLTSRETFWLSRKGRVDADLTLVELGGLGEAGELVSGLFGGTAAGGMLIETDVHTAAATAEALSQYLFAEEVELAEATADLHRLAVHGPTGPALLAAAGGVLAGPTPDELAEGQALVAQIADVPVAVFRRDTAGEVGLELVMPAAGVPAVYERLRAVGEPGYADGSAGAAADSIKLRPAGWLAYNTARIEAGTPLFNIDFGSDHLPAETSVIDHRVSFTKGCYLGQEVVARIHSRGGPKQRLVAIKVGGNELFDADGLARQPVGGTQLLHEGNPVGSVTSSTISPLLGGIPVCFAMLRDQHTEPGTALDIAADGVMLKALVQEGLRFAPKETTDSPS